LLASTSDARSGTFTNSTGEVYSVSLRESPAASYVYVAPELRLGRRFGKHFELNAGVEVLLMAALSQPKWTDRNAVVTGPPPGRGDGQGSFGEQSIAGSLLVFVAPGLGARYDF
jgi:hypothetical protein